MGRKIWNTITMSFLTKENVCSKRDKESNLAKAKFQSQKKSIISQKYEQHVLIYSDQFRSRFELKAVEMKEEMRNEEQ